MKTCNRLLEIHIFRHSTQNENGSHPTQNLEMLLTHTLYAATSQSTFYKHIPTQTPFVYFEKNKPPEVTPTQQFRRLQKLKTKNCQSLPVD